MQSQINRAHTHTHTHRTASTIVETKNSTTNTESRVFFKRVWASNNKSSGDIKKNLLNNNVQTPPAGIIYFKMTLKTQCNAVQRSRVSGR